MDNQSALSRWILRGRTDKSTEAHPEAHPSKTEDEISKKELLKLTGLSYGQLYRWKRMRLIPEHWFIHRSTFTGQGTFFPRAQILKRIETIQRLKEHYSLEEIAQLLSPTSTARRYSRGEVEALVLCPPEGLAVLDAVRGMAGRSEASGDAAPTGDAGASASDAVQWEEWRYTFVDILGGALAVELLARGVPEESAVEAVSTLIAGAGSFSTLDDLHVVCAEFGEKREPFSVLYAHGEAIVFGHRVNIQADVEVGPIAEALRHQLEARVGREMD